MDPRIEQLAYNLVHNSCRLQKAKVMIHQNGIHPAPLVKAIIKEVYKIGNTLLQLMTNSGT